MLFPLLEFSERAEVQCMGSCIQKYFGTVWLTVIYIRNKFLQKEDLLSIDLSVLLYRT